MEKETDTRIGLFDMDGTLADYERSMRYWLNLLKSPGEEDYPIHARQPDHVYHRQCVIRRQPGFWIELHPVNLGFEVLYLAQKVGFTNFHACTKGPGHCSSAWAEKYDWVQKYKAKPLYLERFSTMKALPEDMKITITEDKSTVYGRFLCDDFVPYMESWLKHRKRGLGILIASEENKGFQHPSVVRYDGSNPEEVEERLAWAYQRQSGEVLPENPAWEFGNKL